MTNFVGHWIFLSLFSSLSIFITFRHASRSFCKSLSSWQSAYCSVCGWWRRLEAALCYSASQSQNCVHMGKGWCWRTEAHCRWPPQSSHGRASGRPVLNGRGRSVHYAQRTWRKAVERFWSRGVGFVNPQLLGRTFVYCKEGTLSDGRGKEPAKQGAKIRVRSADKYTHVAKQDYHLDGWNKH